MKPLVIDPSMTSMGGIFYPKGHVFALFPSEAAARQAADALHAARHLSEVAYASPAALLQDLAHTVDAADSPLPSVGAEGDMVRRIADLARSGHHGLLIRVTGKDDAHHAVATIAPHGAATALYYRTFVIEDLIDAPEDEGVQSVVVGTHAAKH